MAPILPHSVDKAQPHSVSVAGYRIRVEKVNKRVLIDNLLRLLRRRAGNPTLTEPQGVTALVRLKIPNGTAQRLFDEHSDVQIGTVDLAAEKLGVKIWHLLTPGGGEQSGAEDHDLSQTSTAAAAPWPLRRLTPEAWSQIDPRDWAVAEDAALEKLKQLAAETAARRSAPPGKQDRSAA